CQRDLGTKMTPPGAPAKPSRAGQTPLLWQGRCPDVWSLKRGLFQKLSSRNLGGFYRLCAQVTKCWHQLEGNCDPGQSGFPASLMLSQFLSDWIGTEVVFYSLVVLRSSGESSRGPWGCLPTLCPR
ncbi:mCG144558, partial [Mus musculus]